MLTWIGQTWPNGGAVCDLGAFLGGSTAHLAHGVSSSLTPDRGVDAFDQFTIADEHKQVWLYDWGYPTLYGNEMRHLFEAFVRPFGTVRAHAGQIEDLHWDGTPIDILFVDIMKGWPTARHVISEFYPCLVPGAVVIHQDFQHWQHPWVVATTEAFSEHLELASWTEENSVIFLCNKPIRSQDIEAVFAQVSDINRVFELIKSASNRLPYARQREAVWLHLNALSRNPAAQYSWDLSL